MEKSELSSVVLETFKTAEGNCVAQSDSSIFEKPLIGVGSAEDPLFDVFKERNVVGPWFKKPVEWLPDANTVVSLFFPFTETVKSANRIATDMPSFEWLYGRVEGQKFLNSYMSLLAETFSGMGISVFVPSLSEKFQAVRAGNGISGFDEIDAETFGSNWSERHAAYVCGLGTFGLSKCLITEKGCAGRLTSIITDIRIKTDVRKYNSVYEYCSRCGICARRCPAEAICTEKGKNLNVCYSYMKKLDTIVTPRHGCGICYTGTPCESRIPLKRGKA